MAAVRILSEAIADALLEVEGKDYGAWSKYSIPADYRLRLISVLKAREKTLGFNDLELLTHTGVCRTWNQRGDVGGQNAETVESLVSCSRTIRQY